MPSVPSLVIHRKRHHRYVKHWLMSDRQEGESCILWSKCWLVKNDAPPNYAVRKLTLLRRCWKPQGKWKWEFLGLTIVEQALLHKGACQEIPLDIHCWASRHSLGFEDEDLGSSPGWLQNLANDGMPNSAEFEATSNTFELFPTAGFLTNFLAIFRVDTDRSEQTRTNAHMEVPRGNKSETRSKHLWQPGDFLDWQQTFIPKKPQSTAT